jgi:hypothetical protein
MDTFKMDYGFVLLNAHQIGIKFNKCSYHGNKNSMKKLIKIDIERLFLFNFISLPLLTYNRPIIILLILFVQIL